MFYNISQKTLDIHGIPGQLGQTLRGGKGNHKDSDVRSNPWSKKSCESSLTGSRNDDTQD